MKPPSMPLHLAVMGDRNEVVKVLIARGASLKAKGKDESTALDVAEARGKTEIAQLLRKHEEKKPRSIIKRIFFRR